jgi:hypothetical protein
VALWAVAPASHNPGRTFQSPLFPGYPVVRLRPIDGIEFVDSHRRQTHTSSIGAGSTLKQVGGEESTRVVSVAPAQIVEESEVDRDSFDHDGHTALPSATVSGQLDRGVCSK